MSSFSAFTLKDGSKLAHRYVLAPLTRGRSDAKTGVPKPFVKEYYQQRGQRAGTLLISEAISISEQGHGWNGAPQIGGPHEKDAIAEFKKVTDAVHKVGSQIYLQLWHMGRQGHSSHRGLHPIAPSAVALDKVRDIKGQSVDGEVPKAATIEDIKQAIKEYGIAAKNSKAAGFDGIEIHAANGYFLNQFLNRKTNKRTDKYGGSPENRFRIINEIIEEVKKVFPVEKIGIRFSPSNNFGDMEVDAKDWTEVYTYALKEVEKHKLGYVHWIDGGFTDGFVTPKEGLVLKDARKLYSGPIIVNGGYDKEKAEATLKEGSADLFALGRPFISNPDLVDRLEKNLKLSPPNNGYAFFYSSEAQGYSDYKNYSEL